MADSLDLAPALADDPRLGALSQIALAAFGDIDLVPVMVYLVDLVDANVLPFLAEQLGLLDCGWDLAATEAAQRAMLKEAARINARRGTPWAIKRVFALLGLGEVTIEEGRAGRVRGSAAVRSAYYVRGDRSDHWATYRVHCQQLLSVDQARAARDMLRRIAPARCTLYEINFAGAALIRNGVARRDGQYTRGSA